MTDSERVLLAHLARRTRPCSAVDVIMAFDAPPSWTEVPTTTLREVGAIRYVPGGWVITLKGQMMLARYATEKTT